MTLLYRLQSDITGLAGGPGLSTFHFLESGGSPGDAQASVEAFWTALLTVIDNAIQISPTQEVVVFEDTTGEAQSFTTVAGATKTGSDVNAALPPATQGLIRWATAGVVNGRRVQGRTFVPGPTESYSSTSGRVEAGYLTAMANAIIALIGGANSVPVVWSRPVTADPGADPPVAGRAGSSHVITGGSGWGDWAVLRGRRDG
jgi:hypothetical protein